MLIFAILRHIVVLHIDRLRRLDSDSCRRLYRRRTGQNHRCPHRHALPSSSRVCPTSPYPIHLMLTRPHSYQDLSCNVYRSRHPRRHLRARPTRDNDGYLLRRAPSRPCPRSHHRRSPHTIPLLARDLLVPRHLHVMHLGRVRRRVQGYVQKGEECDVSECVEEGYEGEGERGERGEAKGEQEE